VRYRLLHGLTVDGTGGVVDREEAARRERGHQAPDDRVRLPSAGNVVHDARQHQRHRLGEVRDPRLWCHPLGVVGGRV